MPLDAAGRYAEAYYESMSADLLAGEPTSLETLDAKEGSDWGVIFSHLEARLGSLRTWRYTWWLHWGAISRVILPRRYLYLVTSNTMNRGTQINQDIIDSTPTSAMEVCAAGLWTGLTSPSRPWFELGVGLPWVTLDQEGAEWLNDTQERLYAVLAQSNFYTIMAQAFQDVTTFGTAPVIMYEDAEDVIRCYLPCAGEYYLAVGSRMSVDTLYREFNLTVIDIVEMFGLEQCPTEVREAWKAGGAALDREFVVAHAIEPNFALADTNAGRKDISVVPGSFPYREVYWLKGRKTAAELSRKGCWAKPFFAMRWSVTSNDAYGRSPGMVVLGDARQLQLETVRKAEYLEKGVRPPMVGNVEMKNEPSSILPGHITYATTEGGKKGFWPAYQVGAEWMAPLTLDIEKIEKRIEKCFYVDVFMAITNMQGVQPRNELELTKRDLERLQQLGPFIELFENETADPAIMYVLGTMERKGALKPKPQSLRDVPIKITYQSMLRQAQIASESATMERAFAVAGNLSAASQAAGEPNPIDNIDLDQSLRTYGDKIGFPSNCWITPEKVAQKRAAKAKAMQEQTAMQATLPAVTAAKTLSETNVGGGQNALAAMIGAR